MSSPPATSRLRARAQSTPFEIALIEPEIPPNTGNIARLCAATNSPLHLVRPLGFRIDDKAVRRAGLDYWPLVRLTTHENASALFQDHHNRRPNARHWFLSGKARRSVFDSELRGGDLLVFGKESVGLPEELLAGAGDQAIAIPTLGAVRSLNLANSVAIALYEGLRQVGSLGGLHMS